MSTCKLISFSPIAELDDRVLQCQNARSKVKHSPWQSCHCCTDQLGTEFCLYWGTNCKIMSFQCFCLKTNVLRFVWFVLSTVYSNSASFSWRDYSSYGFWWNHLRGTALWYQPCLNKVILLFYLFRDTNSFLHVLISTNVKLCLDQGYHRDTTR